ncbi:N-acetyltransferase [Actinocorallia longicatena]|uniref:N-acetyltransferase n=1 Tax=Actinocorallia longicatena TaxID=111803 RepID=A0ABP6Q8Y8_9ACTN
MRVSAEYPADIEEIAAVTHVAFAANEHFPSPLDDLGRPVEVGLVHRLRATEAWIPGLSLVARDGTEMVGHILGTRAHVGDVPVLALGPLSVLPGRWRQGIARTLLTAFVAEADARNEPLVALLGDPAFYSRFGFVLSTGLGIDPPVEEWIPHFQVLPLRAYDPEIRGPFTYAGPFMDM